MADGLLVVDYATTRLPNQATKTMPREANQPAHKSDEETTQIEDKIDLEKLARKIYAMMKDEARIERERLGRRHTR